MTRSFDHLTSIRGQVALVTGGTAGIGGLVQKGLHVKGL